MGKGCLLPKLPGGALEDLHGRTESPSVPEAQDELVPAPAGDPDSLAEVALQGVRAALDTCVPASVPQGVVGRLEAVEVQDRQRERTAVSDNPGEVFGEALLARPAVVGAGQRVPGGNLL